jgi:ribosomal protein S18 acetylase RimI-like enzyme
MPSSDSQPPLIRPLVTADRPAVDRILRDVGNFSAAEIDCALELVDIYLSQPLQKDYRLVVAEVASEGVCGYACWGPTPLTRGTYDFYWLGTHPSMQGRGVGKALMLHVEDGVRTEKGRLLVLETSSKESYGKTVDFYHRLGYEEVARIKNFYDIGDDKLIFIKRISW